MTKGQSRSATFVCDRITKNTARFQEEEADNAAPMIGQLYVQKHALNGTKIEEGVTKIEVTVKVA